MARTAALIAASKKIGIGAFLLVLQGTRASQAPQLELLLGLATTLLLPLLVILGWREAVALRWRRQHSQAPQTWYVADRGTICRTYMLLVTACGMMLLEAMVRPWTAAQAATTTFNHKMLSGNIGYTQMAAKHIKYNPRGENDCLYEALAHGLQQGTAKNLRGLMSSWWRLSHHSYRQRKLKEAIADSYHIEEKYADMLESDLWGGAPEILLFAELFHKRITVHNLEGQRLLTAGKGETIHLVLHAHHYVLAEQLPDATTIHRQQRVLRGGMQRQQQEDGPPDEDTVDLCPDLPNHRTVIITVLRQRYPWRSAFRARPFAWRFRTERGSYFAPIRAHMAREFHAREEAVLLQDGDDQIFPWQRIYEDMVIGVSYYSRDQPTISPTIPFEEADRINEPFLRQERQHQQEQQGGTQRRRSRTPPQEHQPPPEDPEQDNASLSSDPGSAADSTSTTPRRRAVIELVTGTWQLSPIPEQREAVLIPIANATVALRVEEGADVATLRNILGPGATVVREGESVRQGGLLGSDLARLEGILQVRAHPEQIIIPGEVYGPLQDPRLPDLRGGGKKAQPHRTPWESTGSSQGLRCATEIKLNGKQLTQLYSDNVRDSSEGYLMLSIHQWHVVEHIVAAAKVIVILPGRCTTTLKRQGVDAKYIKEQEILLASDDSSIPLRRTATVVNYDHGELIFSLQTAEISIAPTATVEIILEADARWLSKEGLAQVQSNWRSTCSTLASRLLGSTIHSDALYAVRIPQGDNNCWTGRIRLLQEQAMRIMPSSGQFGLFARPSQIEMGAGAHGWTIVWSQFEDVAKEHLLTRLLSIAEGIPGHMGVARSFSNLGLRTIWKSVATTRSKLQPADQRLNEHNLDLQDFHKFRVSGVPAGTTAEQLAAVFTHIKWQSLPQRRLKSQNDHTEQWLATAGAGPEKCAYKWGSHYLVIEEISEEELRKAKSSWIKKQFKEEQPSSSTSTDRRAEAQSDPVYHADPWARGEKRKADASSSATTPSSASASTSLAAPHHNGDPRVDTLAQRVTALERQQTTMQHDIKEVNEKVDDMGGRMDNKFAEVLQLLQQMHTAPTSS